MRRDDKSERPLVVRDSLYSERVLWSGGPAVVRATSRNRALTWVLGVTSAVTTLLAISVSQTTHHPAGQMLFFAGWCATFAVVVRAVPIIWNQSVRFTVTDKHVIWKRGMWTRTIQREGISFARIRWSKRDPGVGDLELVRAVPTGAMNRRLTLTLQGVAAPDRIWSLLRGVSPDKEPSAWDAPLDQRLDPGEQALWWARPTLSWRAWLPLSLRRTLLVALGGLVAMGAVRTVIAAKPLPGRLIAAGMPAASLSFLALMTALALTIGMLLVIAGWLVFLGVARKALLDRKTSYLVTDKRVLLQRGRMEIHLDRRLVVDLVERDGLYGDRDVYLVLDGPQSRAVAANGAFGKQEGVAGFVPLLQSIRDVDGLRRALSTPPRSGGEPAAARA